MRSTYRRLLSSFLPAVVLVSLSACGTEVTGADAVVDADHPNPAYVSIADYRVSDVELLPEHEDAQEAREDVITRILEAAPELAQDRQFEASLRGEAGSYVVLAVPARYKDLAPLIARAYQLSERQQRTRRDGPDPHTR